MTCPPSKSTTTCTTSAECTELGITGTCESSLCNFDQCTSDAQCTNAVCSCQGDTRAYAGSSYGNTCIPGNCRTDADCGSGGYCSPTVSASCGSFYGTQGWYCHTCDDTCADDSDCTAQGTGYCAYDPSVGHWACGYSVCAG